MSETIEVTIRLFGAFRKYDDGKPLQLIVPASATVVVIKEKLGEALAKKFPAFSDLALIGDSVLANDNRIMNPQDRLETGAVLAILPPVCGG